LYLFILPFEASDKGEIANTGGDMPLGSQFGYLFPGAGDRTIAHEVGHGAFNLEHPFDRPLRGSFSKGALIDNLMDYTSGTGFAKIQWDQTRAPGLVIGMFQTDKSGMSDYVKNASQFLKWLKGNIGKKNVTYNKNTFYSGSSWFDVPVKDENLNITFFVEFNNSGAVNFDSGENTNYGVSFDLNNKYHNGFFLRFYYTDSPQKEAIMIWFYSYDNFIKLYQYLGLSLSQVTKDNITASYKQSINNAKSDCNKLDVIYETIPDFVISQISSETLYAGIESLLGCDISHLPGQILLGELNDTDEEKALLNLLKGIDKVWLYNKINSSPNLIEDLIINKMGFRYEKDFIKILSEIAGTNWKQTDYENSNYFTLGSIAIDLSSTGRAKARQTGCLNLGKLGEYKFGTQFQTSEDGILYSDYGGCKGMFETHALTAVFVEAENGESGILPALVVKYLSKQMIDKNQTDFINLSVSLMMPELFISKANGLKVFGKAGSIDQQLLSELNLLANSDDAVRAFVTVNINKLTQSPTTIWEITSDVVRGRVWERVRALTDLRDWQFIGGQNQKLVDFFYNDAGIIMQQKSIRATVTESTLNSYKSSFKTIIDDLAKTRASGSYTLQDGTIINVKSARMDIVVQKGLNYDVLQNELTTYGLQPSKQVSVNFIIK